MYIMQYAAVMHCLIKRLKQMYYTCSKARWTENVFPHTPALFLTLTLTLTLTLQHNNVFGLTK